MFSTTCASDPPEPRAWPGIIEVGEKQLLRLPSPFSFMSRIPFGRRMGSIAPIRMATAGRLFETRSVISDLKPIWVRLVKRLLGCRMGLFRTVGYAVAAGRRPWVRFVNFLQPAEWVWSVKSLLSSLMPATTPMTVFSGSFAFGFVPSTLSSAPNGFVRRRVQKWRPDVEQQENSTVYHRIERSLQSVPEGSL